MQDSHKPVNLMLHSVCQISILGKSQRWDFVNDHMPKIYSFWNNLLISYFIGTLSCPDGYTYFSGRCYSFSGNSDRRSFDNSRDSCVTKGGNLATLDTQEKIDLLHTTFSPR